jgi:hypothetical protein
MCLIDFLQCLLTENIKKKEWGVTKFTRFRTILL